jgi:hypothetical protein
MLVTLMLGAAVGLGFGCYTLGFSRPRGGVFKFLVGLPLGLLGLVFLHLLKLGPRRVFTFAGLGAVTTLMSIHYFEYRHIPDKWTQELKYVALAQQVEGLHQLIHEESMALDKLVAAQRESPTAGRRDVIQAYNARLDDLRAKAPPRLGLDPERASRAAPILRRFRDDAQSEATSGDRDELGQLGPWVASLGFWQYLDLKAQRGEMVEIFGQTIHLGYASSYGLWVGEILLAALLMVLLMRKLAWDQDLVTTFRDIERDYRGLPG